MSVPSDSHRSTVTWCFPTVTSVPGGRVPAGAFRGGMTAGVVRSTLTGWRRTSFETCTDLPFLHGGDSGGGSKGPRRSLGARRSLDSGLDPDFGDQALLT